MNGVVIWFVCYNNFLCLYDFLVFLISSEDILKEMLNLLGVFIYLYCSCIFKICFNLFLVSLLIKN